jgi:hypothetical protein
MSHAKLYRAPARVTKNGEWVGAPPVEYKLVEKIIVDGNVIVIQMMDGYEAYWPLHAVDHIETT